MVCLKNKNTSVANGGSILLFVVSIFSGFVLAGCAFETETLDEQSKKITNYPFEVMVRNVRGNVFSLQCRHDVPARGFNIYDKAKTTSYWSDSNWYPVVTNNTNVLAHRLGYYRESYPSEVSGSSVRGKAYGGRCKTSMSTALSGNGELSARIFVHSNVLNQNSHGLSSTGVFTIGLFADANDKGKYDPKYEFDLAVINLVQNNGKPQIKWGWAGHDTYGIDLSRIASRWVIIKAVIVDDPQSSQPNRKKCKVTIKDEKEGRFLTWDGPEWVPCSLPAPDATATKGRIIVNSRARDPEDGAMFENAEDDRSMITIHWIKWVQK